MNCNFKKKLAHSLVLSLSFLFFLSILTGCLKTRSEVSPNEQSYLNRKKSNESVNAGNMTNKETTVSPVDPEESARLLNGRIEVLENQIVQLQKENAKNEISGSNQKVTALQEALSKMEIQIQKLENEKGSDKFVSKSEVPSAINNTATKASDENLNIKKNSFDIAEELFAKKEWKKSILLYQKFTEEFPKSKQIADAKYKTGVAFQELGLKDEALAFYEEVTVQYPQTAAGKKAKIRITALSAKPAKNKKK